MAEDLTTETFLAAIESIERRAVDTVTVARLVGIARHKLVDHWRRVEREQRRLVAVEAEPEPPAIDDWDVRLDALAAHDVLGELGELGEHHRTVLTLLCSCGPAERSAPDTRGGDSMNDTNDPFRQLRDDRSTIVAPTPASSSVSDLASSTL